MGRPAIWPRTCRACGLDVAPGEGRKSKDSAGGEDRIHLACDRDRNREFHQKLTAPERQDKRLRKKYGISVEDRQRMAQEQGGACAICCRRTPDHVDHNHETGEVRRLLCMKCNLLIGYADEDPEILAAAIKYLETYR